MESYLRERVQASLDISLTDNAVFLCERLFAASPSEANVYLLAKCYQQNRQEYRAYHVLKDGGPYKVLTAESRLLLAQCCMKLGRLTEAEEVLTRKYRGTSAEQVPMGAAGYYLLGKINRITNRVGPAKAFFVKALEKDPTMWTAYEELCKLGAEEETRRYLQNIAKIAGVENDVQLGEQTTPQKVAMKLSNFPHNEQQSVQYDSDAFLTPNPKFPGNNNIGSPRGARRASILPREWPEARVGAEYGNQGDNDDMQEDLGSISKKKPETPVRSRSARPHMYATEVRRSARIAAQTRNRQAQHLQSAPPAQNPNSTQNPSPVPRTPQSRAPRVRVMESSQFQTPVNTPPGQMQVVRYPEEPEPTTPQKIGVFGAQKRPKEDGMKETLHLLGLLGEAYRALCLFRCKEAIDWFTRRLPPNQYFTGWVLCQVAKAYAESVDYHNAEKAFDMARRTDPHRLQDMDTYSTVLWQLGNDAKLTHLANDAMELERVAPQTWCIVGNLHSRQREHETAVRAFQRAMELDANRPYSHTLCGHEYFAVEDFDKAMQCFQMAIQKDSRHYNAWYGCGLVYYRQEKYENAENQFRHAIAINQSSSVLKCHLGMTLAKLHKNEDALAMLQQAINADRKNIISWVEKAKVLQDMGKNSEALSVLEGALTIEHRDPCLHYQIGNVFKKLNSKDEALKHFCEALDLHPSAADANAIRTAIEKINVDDDSQDTEL